MPSKTSTSTPRSPSPDETPAGAEEHFFLRTVDFAFHRQRLSFELARTVFASAGIDPGSALLLRHLQAVGLDGGERVLDLGAGHGTVGIVLAALDERRAVTFVDRDALACAFTERNLRRNGLLDDDDRATRYLVRGSLGYAAVADDPPFDLIVSNIPGKAGEAVITHLVEGSADVARPGAMVGFVVVEPLAPLLERLLVPPRFEPVVLTGNKTHVVGIGRVASQPDATPSSTSMPTAPAPSTGHELDGGLYDRTTQRFSSGQLQWSATTVTGLDEFDTLAQSTRLLRTALQGVRSTPSVVTNPGQGHRAVIAALAGYGPAAIVGRDLLALAATERSLAANGFDDDRALVHGIAVPDAWFDRVPLVLLHADDKTHGPWFTSEVVRYLDHVEASSGRSVRDLVLTGRSGLLGRLEADVLRRRPGHIAYKKSVKGHRVVRYRTGR